ncbi:hypothetical protein LINPERHAP1_LOCUS30827, partial [Linum perenne]
VSLFRRSSQVRGSQSVSLISFRFDLFSIRFLKRKKSVFKEKKKYFRKIKQISPKSL